MNNLEKLRLKLYTAMDKGNYREILDASRQLDKVIVKYVKTSHRKKDNQDSAKLA